MFRPILTYAHHFIKPSRQHFNAQLQTWSEMYYPLVFGNTKLALSSTRQIFGEYHTLSSKGAKIFSKNQG